MKIFILVIIELVLASFFLKYKTVQVQGNKKKWSEHYSYFYQGKFFGIANMIYWVSVLLLQSIFNNQQSPPDSWPTSITILVLTLLYGIPILILSIIIGYLRDKFKKNNNAQEKNLS